MMTGLEISLTHQLRIPSFNPLIPSRTPLHSFTHLSHSCVPLYPLLHTFAHPSHTRVPPRTSIPPLTHIHTILHTLLYPLVPPLTHIHTSFSHTLGVNEYGDVGKIKRRMYHYPNCQDAYINLFCYMNFPRCDPSTLFLLLRI